MAAMVPLSLFLERYVSLRAVRLAATNRRATLAGWLTCLAIGSTSAQALAQEDAAGLGAAASAQAQTLLVIETASYEVDPVVGQHVSAELRRVGEELGYEVLTAPEAVAIAQRVSMAYPPEPADLWAACYAARAERGLFARVWSEQGRYVIEVLSVGLSASSPLRARDFSSAETLHAVVDGLATRVLPTLDARRIPQQADADPEIQAAPEALAHRFGVTMLTVSSFGLTKGGFYNHLFGVRADYRITSEIGVGVGVLYANLEGNGTRADNVLTYIQLEDRIRIIPSSDLRLPLRVGVGYVPFNGPTVRLGAGIFYPFSEHFELEADILAPTFWVVTDRTAVSLDLSIEATYRF